MERSGDNRGGGVSRSHTHVGKHPAQNERFGIYGIPERKKRTFDISKVGEHKICIPKPRVLVQGILRRYRGEEHKSNKGVHSTAIEKRQRKRSVEHVRPTGPIYG